MHFLGNYARSGTTVLEELGAEHLRSGKPILYTSADSVLQIAAHEDVLPINRLYDICEIARRHADDERIGRVIARPFDGDLGHFRRTARRHDYSMKPPRSVLNAVEESGEPVIGVGKIADIFAGEGHHGIVSDGFERRRHGRASRNFGRKWKHGLLFANLVDFDMLYGHRRDVAGYAERWRIRCAGWADSSIT